MREYLIGLSEVPTTGNVKRLYIEGYVKMFVKPLHLVKDIMVDLVVRFC